MKKKNKRRLYWIGGILLLLLVLHISLPFLLVRYVNKTLDSIEGYSGSVDRINVNLFRGAYTIHELDIRIEEGDVPEPFVYSERVDLSVEWSALFKGKIVGEVVMTNPVLTFTIAGGGVKQTGENVDWTEPIKDLMPLQINRFELINGRIHFKDLASDPLVDLYFENVNGVATNLSNVTRKDDPLPSDLNLTATSIGDGSLYVDGQLNILRQVPDFDINLTFESVHLPALNDFIKAYAKADVEGGTLNLYAEFLGTDGALTGYVKPLLVKVEFLDWQKDKKKPLQFVWETVVGGVAELFENQKKDQLGSKVPLEGSYENIGTKVFAAIGSALRNAFINSLEERTDGTIDLSDEQGEAK